MSSGSVGIRLVGSQQRVKLSGGLAKECAVAKAGPPHLRYGANVVTGEKVGQRSG